MEPDVRDHDRPDAGEPPANPGQPAANDLRAAAAELATLAERPLEEHISIYERLHAQMQAALRSVAE